VTTICAVEWDADSEGCTHKRTHARTHTHTHTHTHTGGVQIQGMLTVFLGMCVLTAPEQFKGHPLAHHFLYNETTVLAVIVMSIIGAVTVHFSMCAIKGVRQLDAKLLWFFFLWKAGRCGSCVCRRGGADACWHVRTVGICWPLYIMSLPPAHSAGSLSPPHHLFTLYFYPSLPPPLRPSPSPSPSPTPPPPLVHAPPPAQSIFLFASSFQRCIQDLRHRFAAVDACTSARGCMYERARAEAHTDDVCVCVCVCERECVDMYVCDCVIHVCVVRACTLRVCVSVCVRVRVRVHPLTHMNVSVFPYTHPV